MIQKLTYIILCALLLCSASTYAQKKTFTRNYTYQASEADSKITARTMATTQMRNILLREIGEFLHTERTLTQTTATQDYSEKIKAITAGIVEMKVLDEQWNGETYYIQAQMTVDLDEVNKRIAEVLNDKQKTKELEETRQKVLAAEAEMAKLRLQMEEEKRRAATETDKMKKELQEAKGRALQETYQKQADVLSAEEYITRGYNANNNKWFDLAVENYQKAISIDPNNATAYNNLGCTYNKLKDYKQGITYLKKAIAIDPNYAWAYGSLGYGYYELKDYEQAITYLQKSHCH